MGPVPGMILGQGGGFVMRLGARGPTLLTRVKAHWSKASSLDPRWRDSGFGFAALAEPEALAVHLEDLDVVGQAVEDGAGQALRAEDLGPLVEGQVRGDDD